jgi:hypothetical protein
LERNSESFLSRGTAGIPPEQTSCSVNSVFRGIIFLSEIATPYPDPDPKFIYVDPDLDPSANKQKNEEKP